MIPRTLTFLVALGLAAWCASACVAPAGDPGQLPSCTDSVSQGLLIGPCHQELPQDQNPDAAVAACDAGTDADASETDGGCP